MPGFSGRHRAAGKAFGYTRKTAMSPKAQEVLEQLRALPRQERLRIVEQVMHETEPQKAENAADAATGLWADVPDDEFDAFMKAVRELRESDQLRLADD